MNFISLLNTVATIAVLLLVGFFSRKGGLIDDAFSKKLSNLIVKIGQPMLLLSNLISLEYSAENLKRGLIALSLSLGIHFFIGVLAHIVTKGYKNLDEKKIAEFAVVFANCGFIGFPIIESLYGKEGLFCGAFYLIGFHIFTWSWGIFILSRGRDDIKLTPKKIFINLGTVPSFIGIFIFLLPLPVPEFVPDSASYIASLCTPISLFITGSLIATDKVTKLFSKRANYPVIFLRLVISPLLVCALLKILGFSEFYVMFGTVMAAMPSGAIATMFSEMYSLNSKFASQLVGGTSILCVATLPLVVLAAQRICAL